MNSFSIRYWLLTYRLDQLWLPAAFWALFAILALFFRGDDRVYDITRAFVGGMLPLLGGIMSAYALLDDPTLELQFATPVSAFKMLAQRTGLTYLIIGITAVSFQFFLFAMGVNLSRWVDPIVFQFTWIVPGIAFLALGTAAALASANSVSGALLAGLVWAIELIARDGLLADRLLRYVLVFMALVVPNHPDLWTNLAVLSASAALMFALAWGLLKKQERYL